MTVVIAMHEATHCGAQCVTRHALIVSLMSLLFDVLAFSSDGAAFAASEVTAESEDSEGGTSRGSLAETASAGAAEDMEGQS